MPSKELEYIKVYLLPNNPFSSIPRSHSTVLYELVKHKTPGMNEMTVFLNAAIKRRISESIGITIQNLNYLLSSMCKKNIIKRVEYGTYQINPFVIGIGEWKDIYELQQQWLKAGDKDET